MFVRGVRQTKSWRHAQSWYRSGKSNECEKYQESALRSIGIKNIGKCHDRICEEGYFIEEKIKPYIRANGFEYTENFDYKCAMPNETIYFNLKFVCDNGGAQSRTLRCTYMFIKSQLKVLDVDKSICFVNILDGDGSSKVFDKFEYLLSKVPHYKSRCFVGDMYSFQFWWKEKYLL